jgi:UDP-glucose 4-epimerase
LIVIVTGGAGFIGSHIVDKLVLNGYEVVVIDSLIHGKTENLNDKAKFYKNDIRDAAVLKVFMQEKPDYAMHMAAQIEERCYVDN